MSRKTITTTDAAHFAELREQNPDAPIIVAEPNRVRVLHRPGRAPRQIAFVATSRYSNKGE